VLSGSGFLQPLPAPHPTHQPQSDRHHGVDFGFWNVGSSATIDTTTSFQGNILALTSISLNTAATIGCGRALADTGAVTLQQNTISIGCAGTGEEGSNGLSGGGIDVVGGVARDNNGTVVSVPGRVLPEPGTLVLFGFGLAALLTFRKRLLAVA